MEEEIQRESNGDKRLKPNVERERERERERESQTCFFSWGLEIGCDGNKLE